MWRLALARHPSGSLWAYPRGLPRHRELPERALNAVVAIAAEAIDRHTAFLAPRRRALDRHRWDTHGQLRLAIITWIDRTYHRRRVALLVPGHARERGLSLGEAPSTLLWDNRGHRSGRGVTVCGLAAGYVAELVTNWRSLG